MQTIPLAVFDETLRDGEQQAGIFFAYEEKLELAHLIVNTGINYIDIMPAVDQREERLVKTLVSLGLDTVVTPATMMNKCFIDHSLACGVKRVILFCAVSDRLLFLRDAEVRRDPLFHGKTVDDNISEAVIHKIRQNMLNNALENLRYATSKEVGLEVDFAAEDASRTDFDFLVECIRQFRPYLGHFMLCDTVGVLTPERTSTWIDQLLQSTDGAPLAVHFHNDLGLALENTLQAILAGATMVSGTFGGIGERAGNAALEQVLNGLRVRFGLEVEGINYDAFLKVTNYLAQLGAVAMPPYSKQAQQHESGIHVNSLLQDTKSYHQFDYTHPEIGFGKYSGASNFQYLFERHLQYSLSKKQYNKIRDIVKAYSIREQRCFTAEEIISMFDRGMLDV